MALVLDTGPFAMLLMGSRRMHDTLRQRLGDEDILYVPSVAFYEIGQKTRLGKWTDMEPYVAELEATAQADGFEILPLSGATALLASQLDWPHRDPFDRMIAAAALREGLPVVSPDAAFDAVGVERVWG